MVAGVGVGSGAWASVVAKRLGVVEWNESHVGRRRHLLRPRSPCLVEHEGGEQRHERFAPHVFRDHRCQETPCRPLQTEKCSNLVLEMTASQPRPTCAQNCAGVLFSSPPQQKKGREEGPPSATTASCDEQLLHVPQQ